MRINNINLCTTSFKGQPHFRKFVDEDRQIVSSTLREDELYDYDEDVMDADYRKYDEDDLPLSIPKQPFAVPIDYLSLYCLKDARTTLVDGDVYQEREIYDLEEDEIN